MEKSVSLQKNPFLLARLQDYAQLTKMRLASLVVFSAAMAFLLAPGSVNWNHFILLIIGGFLVTGASNGINQIMERDLDKLMTRTANRPLPGERMSVAEAFIISALMAVAGIFILTYYLNLYSGLLGMAALMSYTLAYTPLKRITPLSVFIGAIPGAIPPMLGWIAATGTISAEAWILFAIQFMWQFPHFWAIAWVLDDDYKRAGFNMLPTGERNKSAAFQTFIYTLSLIPVGLMPFLFQMSGWVSAVVITLAALYFSYRSYRLYREQSIEAARSVMFGSFIYLPIVMIAMVLDKL